MPGRACQSRGAPARHTRWATSKHRWIAIQDFSGGRCSEEPMRRYERRQVSRSDGKRTIGAGLFSDEGLLERTAGALEQAGDGGEKADPDQGRSTMETTVAAMWVRAKSVRLPWLSPWGCVSDGTVPVQLGHLPAQGRLQPFSRA